MIRKSLLTMILLAGCGPTAAPGEGASLGLNLRFEQPTLSAQATETVEEQLQDLIPVKLRVLVCDRVTLSSQVKVHCSVESNDYNYLQTVDLMPGGGTALLTDVPAAVDQVIIAQGLDTAGSLTYQGASTQAVIASRGRHNIDITMTQVKFPVLPPPAAPEITNAEADLTVASEVKKFTFTGTREAGTVLKVITNTSAFGIGSSPIYRGDSGTSYQETESGDTISWQLNVNLPDRATDLPVSYHLQFSAARISTPDKFGEERSVVLKACAAASGGGDICPP